MSHMAIPSLIGRSQNQLVGFTECVRMNKITSMKQERLSIKLKRFKLDEADESNDDERMSEDDEEKIADKGLFVHRYFAHYI